MIFTIPGKPQGKGRPRFSTKGKFVSTYTPEKTKEYENLVQESFLRQCKGQYDKDYVGEVKVKIIAYFEPPKSMSKKKYKELIDGRFGYLHKPDTDNVAKVILDSLNGLAYKDDNQVSCLLVIKEYAETSKVEVEIEYLG